MSLQGNADTDSVVYSEQKPIRRKISMIHELKCEKRFFDAVINGEKTFEMCSGHHRR